MKIKEAREMYEKLSGLSGKKLPIKIAFVVAKNQKILKDVVDLSTERANDIVDRCAKKKDGKYEMSEDGRGIAIADADLFRKEMTELEETDMDIELGAVAMSEVEKCDEDRFDSLTPDDVAALIIEDE